MFNKRNKSDGFSKAPRPAVIVSFLAACFILISFVEPAAAQSATWTGNAPNSDWNDPTNWSSSSVPGPGYSVTISPSNGNPYPVISNQDVTIASLTISNWSGGELTVSNSKTLTITNGLTMNGGSKLYINTGGNVYLSGGNFSMSYNNSVIDMNSGSFTSDVDIEIKGDGFNAGSGTVTVNANFNLPSGKEFNVETATVTVTNTAEINGTFNGDDGNTMFQNTAEIQSGGVVNLDTGTITFNGSTYVRNNGTLNMGSGTVNLNAGLTVESDGNVYVQNGSLDVQGDADFQNNGNLSVDNGSVNVTGDATLQNGGSFTLTNGSMNIGGNASFTNGGTVDAGNSQIELKGDMTVQNGGDFDPGTSTVTFSGDGKQTINAGNNDVEFYNVVVKSGSSVQTDGSSGNTIIIENNMSVEEDGQVDVQGNDNIDVRGDLDNQGDVQSEEPFVYAISTPSTTEVLVTFDQPMDEASTGNASNYSIDNGVTISGATFHANDSTVTLHVSPLSDNVEYTLSVSQNVKSEDGGKMSNNHTKRFHLMVDATYYSRASGDWDDPDSWSTESHAGAAASAIPNAQDDEEVIIANGHTITLGSTQDISNMAELTINGAGTLEIASGDTLTLGQLTISGSGTFDLQGGGTLKIGSPNGIEAEGSNEGNIQTSTRNYSSSANYIYNGNGQQKTGSGLPVTVKDLRINSVYGVEVQDNLRTNGTLYPTDGPLIFPSGKQLIANNRSIGNGDLIFNRVISGNQGWRALSSPIASTYRDLLDSTVTQGYTNSQFGLQDGNQNSLQTNVLYYLEDVAGTDNQHWRAPGDATNSLTAGQGMFVYFFGSVPEDNRYNNALPDTLTVRGQEFTGSGGDVSFDVTRTDIELENTFTTNADSGWNLVGNPFASAIDWDDNTHWTKTNMDNTIYVWDPSTGSYKTWNGNTGSLGSGLIPPFQAFWVKANGSNPALTVNEEAKTFGGNFVGKHIYPDNPRIAFNLSHKNRSSNLFVSFTQDARRGKDPGDAFCLLPPPDVSSYLQLYSLDEDGNRYSINTVPREFGASYEIPLHAQFVQLANSDKNAGDQQVTLSWPSVEQIPSSWTITLTDGATNKKIDISQQSSYAFRLPPSKQKGKMQKSGKRKSYKILTRVSPDQARFILTVNPGTEGAALPSEVSLQQNYPNPFNPSTTIQFNLPIQSEVSLTIYDMLGREVATLINQQSYSAGQHSVNWNASGYPSGVYFYRLTTPEGTFTKKLTLIK
ncbi:T9SS type A sorting domain-containing protein [Aliifodinibius sp. S!AR15-10]|uniref:T9SS type A sorting domain-containing protein n=1 Tax=Aliifodinibius sp. S!AR15-10 TaxID=2950437 RepID=UPI00285B588B|nr:T9SS type A sorting domain-containing protein [Aliifodinibius sp. S!AR15-10]MDR8390849.1 T9SS type A sorting domain-containing protein [Aliifodinibius sp. S!AR15-10]